MAKRKFYNTGYKHLKNKVAVEKLHGEENIETFDDLRAVFTDPRNDKHRWAFRTDPEEPELIMTDKHIDENFIILQTRSQMEIMRDSTVLNVDQNHEATPPGASRTLTISARYKGKTHSF